MSEIDFILLFSNGLEIVFTFNIHHPLSPLLLTIALAGLVRPADKRHLAEKNVSLYFKNYLKNRQKFFIGDDY